MRRLPSCLRLALAVVLTFAVLAPSAAACACGCGVFDVGTSALLPTHPGGFAYLEADHLDQRRNWSGTRAADGAANPDKRVRTEMFTGGVQYMFDRTWGYMVDVPVWARRFEAADAGGNLGVFDHGGVGDVRVRGVYAGFSSDLSAGLTFGLKLPTGSFRDPDFDRDTQIGSGSTDVLLGAYRVVPLGAGWKGFANLQWDEPVLNAGGYRPGAEVDAIAGAYFDALAAGGARVAPLVSVVGARRWRDLGVAAHPGDTGYERVVLAPGFEASKGRVRVYGDVGFPVYQRVNGNQLVAPYLTKLNVGWSF